MKELLKALKKYGLEKDYAMMDIISKSEGQDFLDFLCEKDLIHDSRLNVMKDRLDADYFGHAQHLLIDDTFYNLITLLTPTVVVLLHEVAHCLVFKVNPEWAMEHVNHHGKEFDKAMWTAYYLYLDFKGAF